MERLQKQMFIESINHDHLEKKRVFRMVWRPVTAKKQKTWKGDGFAEVTDSSIKMKDENNKFMLATSYFKRSDVEEGLQITIEDKEFELLEEIAPTEEYVGNTEPNKQPSFAPGPVIDYTPAGNKRRFLEDCKEINCENSKNSKKTTTQAETLNIQEYICFVKITGLQRDLFKKCAQIFNTISTALTNKNLLDDLTEFCQLICDHPILLESSGFANSALLNYVIEDEPHWSEMGPYDSSKFEFVKGIIDKFVCIDGQNCAIVAENTSILQQLMGYCEFKSLDYLMIDDAMDTALSTEWRNGNTGSIPIILMNCNSTSQIQVASHNSIDVKLVIYYNYQSHEKVPIVKYFTHVQRAFYLVTAGSIEEFNFQRQWLPSNFQINSTFETEFSKLFQLINNDCDFLTHETLGCTCPGDGSVTYTCERQPACGSWQHFSNDSAQKIVNLEIHNLLYIFKRQLRCAALPANHLN